MIMSDQLPTTIVGCLLDVSGSMREALEPENTDETKNEGAGERLDAVLRTALKVAQAEQKRNHNALVFVGVFGLKEEKGSPVVDLCSVVEGLLSGYDGEKTGHELLIQLANRNNLSHITKYIKNKFVDSEARIIYTYLLQHPERIEEFVKAIPTKEEMDRNMTRVQGFRYASGALSAAYLGFAFGLPGLGIGAVLGSGFGSTGADAFENHTVETSDGLRLARQMCTEWWQDFENFLPRPVGTVVNLLQKLQNNSSSGNSGEHRETHGRGLLDTLCSFMYGRTPLQNALSKSLATFRGVGQDVKQRILMIVSDGVPTDGDPLEIACKLRDEGVNIAAVYLTSDKHIPTRRLYYHPHHNWNRGQHALFEMASPVAGCKHPIPVLASLGWEIPSSGECKLYTAVCSTTVLDEFCSMLLSARFSSAETLLDILGRVQLDSFIDDQHVQTCKIPSDQGREPTCYAHAAAAVIRMALLRIEGREGGYPSIEEIRERILSTFQPKQGGACVLKVLKWATVNYRPLKFKEVDEDGARQAVLHRRPVLATYRLSLKGWEVFYNSFRTNQSQDFVLTYDLMKPHRVGPDGGGHAVILTKCNASSLTFLNSWGKTWGAAGSFSVENPATLTLEQAGSRQEMKMSFYDIYWLEKDLTKKERKEYNFRVDSTLRAGATKYSSILDIEINCPICNVNSPVADFAGSDIRQTTCPRCYQSFTPELEHLLKALDVRRA